MLNWHNIKVMKWYFVAVYLIGVTFGAIAWETVSSDSHDGLQCYKWQVIINRRETSDIQREIGLLASYGWEYNTDHYVGGWERPILTFAEYTKYMKPEEMEQELQELQADMETLLNPKKVKVEVTPTPMQKKVW